MTENKPLAVDTGRGFSINYRGINLYSRYNPVSTPEKIASSLSFEEETLYILPSPLFFYGVDILLKNLPDSSFILALETDQELMKLSIPPMKSMNREKIVLVRIDSREPLKQIIEEMGIWRFRRCRLVSLNNGYNLNRDIYDYLFQFAARVITTFWRNRLTVNKLAPLWIKNILWNFSSIRSAYPENENKPVVLCGAGPSLEDSLPLLKQYRNRIYILAVDTALSTLLAAEIVPDLVYALESQFYNLGDFYGSGRYSFDILADYTSYPQVCRLCKQKLYFTYTDFYPNKLTDRMKETGFTGMHIPPLGSVGVAAVAAALKLFSGDIFLTGLDFSYQPGKSHTKDSPFIKSRLSGNNRFSPVESDSVDLKNNRIIRPGKHDDSFILTDTVLETYALLLREILSHESRVFDLGNEGYPLGIPQIEVNDFVEKMMNSRRKDQEHKEIASVPDHKSFLMQEILRLDKLIRIWEDYAESTDEEIPENLMEALADVDYIYLDFPDRLPHPVRDVSFISRAVKKARHYTGLINRIIGSMNNS